MMKILLLLLLTFHLHSASFWTLTGVTKARIFIKDFSNSIDTQTIKEIETKMLFMLAQNNIQLNLPDSPTLMLSIDKLASKKMNYVHINLSLGEEVKTQRKNNEYTYAKTYSAYDFIETSHNTLNLEILESVEFLLSQFDELYKEDN